MRSFLFQHVLMLEPVPTMTSQCHALLSSQQGTGLSWLFPLVDGHPPIGWLPALSYLVMPVLLVLSQYASMQLNAAPPPAEGAKVDEAANTTASVLKFLPLMIGESLRDMCLASL